MSTTESYRSGHQKGSRLDGFHFDAAGNSIIFLVTKTNDIDALSLWDRVKECADLLHKCSPDMFAIVDTSTHQWRATFWNPDKTPEKVCINALRCVHPLAQLLLGQTSHTQSISIETHHCMFNCFIDSTGRAGTSMPCSSVFIDRVSDGDYIVDVGTPHRVRIVRNLVSDDISRLGYMWSEGRHPVNATFIKAEQDGISVRTFERGVGETGSCGSGALASYIVANREFVLKDVSPSQVPVHFRSGHVLFVSRHENQDSYCVAGEVNSAMHFFL